MQQMASDKTSFNLKGFTMRVSGSELIGHFQPGAATILFKGVLPVDV
jgi:hypothetical protein